MKIENFKIYSLNPEECEIVQKTLFENNCCWADQSRSLKCFHYSTLQLTDKGLRGGENLTEDTLNSLEGEKITFSEFKERYIDNCQNFTKQQMFDFSQFYANNTDDPLPIDSVDEVLLLRIKKRNALRTEITKVNPDFDVEIKELDKIINFVESYCKLEAVRYLKEISNFGLRYAKDCVDILDTIH